MRACLVALALMLLCGGVAHADKKLAELATGYQRESETCAIQAGGIAKVADGAQQLAAATPDDAALADAVAKLAAGRTVVDDYCAQLTGVLAVLSADPTATYRSLERELDERDNKIRAARNASKKAIDGLQPVIHELIPRINAARVGPADIEKRTPTKFPSGHAIELPRLPGTWRLSGSATSDTADYTDKTLSASVWTHTFSAATCDQQRHMLPIDAKESADRPAERALADDAKGLGVAWSVSYIKRIAPARVVLVTCLPAKTGDGGVLATAELQPVEPAPPAAFVDTMAELMTRMLAVAAAPPPAPPPG
jgi:hypothetical protein